MHETRQSRRDFVRTAAWATAGLAGASWLPLAARAAAAELDLQIGGYAFDRVLALSNDEVAIKNCTHQFNESNIYGLNAMAMGGAQEFDVQEIGLHPFMLAHANDSFRDYTLLPVFPLRTFRHKSMYIRADRGIDSPAKLRGKTVATPGYSQSSLTWIRGILSDEYGVEPEEMNWVIARKSSDGGAPSKNESMLPKGVPIEQGPIGVDEGQLLVDGKVDAAFTAIPPRAFSEGNPIVVRLFPNYKQTEQDYFKKTGIFPIMHAVAIRRTLAKQHPWLSKAVFDAYSQAKSLNYQRLKKMGWAMISLPWVGEEIDETRKLMGENWWPYGIEPNRVALEALFRYSHAQGLASKRLTIEELFEPSTLALTETSA